MNNLNVKKQNKAYINGKFINKKEQVKIISPLNNQIIGSVPALNLKDINLAFESAHKSFSTWSKLSSEKRIDYIKLFSNNLNKSKQKFVEMIHQEIGKPMGECLQEIERSLEYIDKTIKTYQKIVMKVIKIKQKRNYIYRVPLGVVLAISPFNYPVNLSLSKIIPGLLSGNTVVFKPATNGSIIGTMLCEVFEESKFPAGVINLVTGKGTVIGDSLTNHPLVSMISFTGSVEVGKRIAQHGHLIPLVLELGGNDGAYVRNDAKIKDAAKLIAVGAFGFAGQRCTAIKRLIVHKKIKQEFIAELIKEIKLLPIIPLINQASSDWVYKLLRDSYGKVLIGGNRVDNMFENTLIETNTQTKAWTEEAFGPLLPVVYVESDDEAIMILNNTNYGLQNSLFTSDINWAKKVGLKLECGTVNINAASSRGPDEFPFLGVKDSGFGVQGIEEALLSMTRYLNVINNE